MASIPDARFGIRGAAGDTLSESFDPRRPALVTLAVADLACSLEFWHARLGLPVRLRAGGIAELQSESIQVVLVEGPRAGGAGATLGWEVADLGAARRDLEALGIACEDVATPAGVDPSIHGRRIRFLDPDGHALELVSWS